uniref:Phosphoprotein n=1 Tax=Heterorhabditis bacteriophora TaxID=37862 RepID=A0A1I7XN83_HETBA
MVWRKMEGLRDEAVIDRLQNRIMNLIHDALADQNNATVVTMSRLNGEGTDLCPPINESLSDDQMAAISEFQRELRSCTGDHGKDLDGEGNVALGNVDPAGCSNLAPDPIPSVKPKKVFFPPQKYGFFTANNVRQRWRQEPDSKANADDIIANVTEMFYGQSVPKRPTGNDWVPSTIPPGPPPFLPPLGKPPKDLTDGYGFAHTPPPPMIPPPGAPIGQKRWEPSNDGPQPKRPLQIAANDDENELFVKLLYKKLQSISNKKRVETLHVEIMSLVKIAQEQEAGEQLQAQ